MEGYICEKFFTIKKWDVHPTFMRKTIYHVRTEMRQSLVKRLNCGTAELPDKEYSVCGFHARDDLPRAH